jgi:Ca-activated chloride channel family protein
MDSDESGVQPDSKDDNLPIDKTDEGDTEGGDKEGDPQDEGGLTDQPAGKGGLPDEITEEDAAASQAVDQFDQLETGLGEKDEDAPPGIMPDEEGIAGSGVSMIMMEQWLERIEGDPAYLLRNQFMIEERQALDRHRGLLMETRPW